MQNNHDSLAQGLTSSLRGETALKIDDPDSRPRAGLPVTLEDNEELTAHFLGPSSEQDGCLLDTFKSSILSERPGTDASIIQVSDGNLTIGQPPTHFLLLKDEFPDHVNHAKNAISESIERKVWPHGPALVRLYFKHVHPVYPVLSKSRFLRQYSTAKDELPPSLRGAVYALASVFWNSDESPGKDSVHLKQYELSDLAHSSLRHELEAPDLAKLQSCLLLLHNTPPEMDSVETPSIWMQAAQATACAQMIGLHKDPSDWSIAVWEKRIRRRLWWAVFVADCWASICHGNPSHISPDSFDTSPLEEDDVRSDEIVPEDFCYLVEPENQTPRVADVVRFMRLVELSRNVREVLTYGL